MKIYQCLKCDLCISRKTIVSGEGPTNVKMMIIGEAPGATEDRLGRPFVGKAGAYLLSTLEHFGFKRHWFYLTTIVKCKPLSNNPPNSIEIANCYPYLLEEIKEIKPILILTLGNIATSVVRNELVSISKLRGTIWTMGETKLMCTYNPAYVVKNPELDTIFNGDIYTFSLLYKQYLNPFFKCKEII